MGALRRAICLWWLDSGGIVGRSRVQHRKRAASVERFKTDALTTRPRQLGAIFGTKHRALTLATGFEPARDYSHQLSWRSTLRQWCGDRVTRPVPALL